MGLEKFFGGMNYDIRIKQDARFMDQKCTPDVVCIIADCIMNIRENAPENSFTVQDIWHSSYFIKNVKAIFNKPSAKNPTTRSEYDKFIQQPLRLLAYAGVLHLEKSGNTNQYYIKDINVLEYVSMRDRNAYKFLYQYFIKVLRDSNLLKHFEIYKRKYENQSLTQQDFKELQERFVKFIIGNTPINGEIEVKRIYPKLLNIYACENNLPGSIKGRMAKHEFYYVDLMYNRMNWRDKSKDKNMSRQEAQYILDFDEDNTIFNAYLTQKAVNQIKKMYSYSEVKDQWADGEATQVHHIFPKGEFPQLAHYLENLIKLTPTQHYTKAHPNNKTNIINKDYQLVCLLAKAESIEKSLKKYEPYYKKECFIHCINTGLNKTLDTFLNFRQIKITLTSIYNDT